MKARPGMELLALLLLVGCQTPPLPATKAPAEPTLTMPESARADESLGAEVRRRLTAAGNDLVGVMISVNNGVITLGGSVPSIAAAMRAEAAARGVDGVRGVRNEVLIRGGY